MRYAIVSDLHANLQAWNAVLNDIELQKIDEIICLGDIVGYGPKPAEVLESAYEYVHHFVMGNHDAVIAGLLGGDLFNDNARRIIEWTDQQLDPAARDFFKEQPLALDADSFFCTHADPAAPGQFGYLIDPEDTVDSWTTVMSQTIFVGHSHLPKIFVLGNSRTVHELDPVDFNIEMEKRYIVNVGSVGNPRGGDLAASYVVFDTDKGDVCYRRVAFDIDAYAQDLRQEKLPEEPSYFLQYTGGVLDRAVREKIDFHPRTNEESEVKTSLTVEKINQNHDSSNGGTRSVVLVFLGFIVVAALVAMTGFGKPRTEKGQESDKAIQTQSKTGERLRVIPESSVVLQPPMIGEALFENCQRYGPVKEGNPLKYFEVVMADRKQQSVTVRGTHSSDAEPVIVCQSQELALIELISVPVDARAGHRFSGKVRLNSEGMQEGYVEVVLERYNPVLEQWQVLKRARASSLLEQVGWRPFASVTMSEGFSKLARLRVRIVAHLKGELRMKRTTLLRKD
jgi:predicted phosphodiesterase